MLATDPVPSMNRPAGLGGAAMVSIVVATSLAVLMLNVAPAAEAQLRHDAHLSVGQVGTVFFVELAAMGLASIPALAWFGRADASGVARCAYAVFILGNLLSAIHPAPLAFYAAARAITGAGAGTLMVLGMGLAARARQPDRLYALITFWQLASGALMLHRLSAVTGEAHGLDDVFLACAGLGALGFIVAGSLPRSTRGNPPPPGTQPTRGPGAWRGALLSVAFAMTFNLVVGGLWSFVAEYAGTGVAPARVALVLVWATAAGLVGATSAYVVAARWPRRRLLMTGYLGILLGAGLLQFARGSFGFAAGCCVLSLAWSFSVPYVFAAVAGMDPSGRLMSAANLAFAFGLALGPLLAGQLIEAAGLDALFPCALAGLALGALLAMPVTRASSA